MIWEISSSLQTVVEKSAEKLPAEDGHRIISGWIFSKEIRGRKVDKTAPSPGTYFCICYVNLQI
jgi:hypothetical protein